MPVWLSGNFLYQLMAVVLTEKAFSGYGSAMSFVHDDQIRTVQKEGVLVTVAFYEIDTDHLNGVVAIDAFGSSLRSIQLRHSPRPYENRIEIELFGKLLLPLIAEVWRAEDAETFDFSTIEHFAGDQKCLDGFSHPDVIGDEQPHRVDTEPHEERDKLVGAWPDGNSAK
jgi:hypothetical protein